MYELAISGIARIDNIRGSQGDKVNSRVTLSIMGGSFDLLVPNNYLQGFNLMDNVFVSCLVKRIVYVAQFGDSSYAREAWEMSSIVEWRKMNEKDSIKKP